MTKAIAVFLQRGAQWNPEKSVREQAYWDEHAQFMDALFDEGKLILGGPFNDNSGSMVILAVECVEAARAIFQYDPWAHHDILHTSEIKEWVIFLDARNKT
ncbi:MAG TPA: YciI family protein [Blastocatellia bacterium]|nr:YciI family protein [Blastocatellia bacterium]